MRRIKIFSFLVVAVMVFGFTLKVNAYETVCETGDKFCSGSYKKVCNSSHTGYNSTYCTYGCSGGWCNNPPPINGRCSVTTKNRCTAGNASKTGTSDDTESEYKWKCLGIYGGTTASCSLAKPCIEGTFKCEGTTRSKCIEGYWESYSNCPDGCNGTVCYNACNDGTFKCEGTTRSKCIEGYWESYSDCPHGCNGTVCKTQPPIPGECGGSAGQTFLGDPPKNGFCNVGRAIWVDYVGNDGTYNWRCLGQYGGSDADCPAESGKGDCKVRFPFASASISCVGDSGLCIARGGSALGQASDCNNGDDVCCYFDLMDQIKCYEGTCGTCNKCINPGVPNTSDCVSTRTYAGSGIRGDASGKSYCTMPTTDLCDSDYGVTLLDTNGDGGTFDWMCNGQEGGDCRDPGIPDYGSATKISSGPVVNGRCKSNVTGISAEELCFSGTPTFDSRDADHNYIDDSNPLLYVWGCAGSTSICGDGTSQIGCESNQKSWFRVTGGSVIAKGNVDNSVPAACVQNCYTASGVVWSKGTNRLSTKDSSANYGNQNLNIKSYSYDSLKQRFFTTKGVGTTINNESTNWSTISGNTGVIFIDGNLTIDTNLATTDFVMIIASKTITIDPTVNRVDAILMGTDIIASENSDSKLVINGIVYGTNSVEFSRGYITASRNDTEPAIEVNYSPRLLFQIPVEITRALSQWKVN